MSVQDYQYSDAKGNISLLYRFSWNGGGELFYTDAERVVVWDSESYVPAAMSLSEIRTEPNVEDRAIEIECADNLEIVTRYAGYPSGQVVFLTIMAGHIGRSGESSPFDQDFFRAVWTGRLTEVVRKRVGSAVLYCNPGRSMLSRPGLTRNYLYPCQHPLYGSRCGVNKADWLSSTTTVSATTSVVELSSGWEHPSLSAGHYVGGLLEWTYDGATESRAIRAVSGNTLHLSGATLGLAPSGGDAVSVYPGCNRRLATCHDVFENAVNYGGFPFIPGDNPVGKNTHW